MENAYIVSQITDSIETGGSILLERLLENIRNEIAIFIRELPPSTSTDDLQKAIIAAVTGLLNDDLTIHNKDIRRLRDTLMRRIEALNLDTADQI